MPILSVILPVYNASRYLAVALDSICAQTLPDFEVLAVNDGSTDDSLEILRRYVALDSRVKIFSRPNTGIVGALNDAIFRSNPQSEYLARMDADDIAMPDRFERQLTRMRAHPQIAAMGSAVIFIDDDGAPVKKFTRPLAHTDIERSLLSGDGGAMIHPAVIMRRDAVIRAGGYRREMQYVEDIDLFLRLAQLGQLANHPDFLLRYRVHPTSINFTRQNPERSARKLNILQQAHAARGIEFTPPPIDNHHALDNLHREWAVTSLAFGDRSVALKHARVALREHPFSPAAWRAYRYARTAPLH